jgi:hypothetical protein
MLHWFVVKSDKSPWHVQIGQATSEAPESVKPRGSVKRIAFVAACCRPKKSHPEAMHHGVGCHHGFETGC